jgi:Ca2+-binding EF-hand superfamily protein
MNARHSLALLRLKQNITKAGPMTQEEQSLYSDDISLPSIALQDPEDSKDEKQGGTTDSKKTRGQSKLLVTNSDQHADDTTKKKKPDQDKLDSVVKKVMDAQQESIPPWEEELNRKKDMKMKKSMRRRRANNSQHSHTTIVAIERKLACSIKRCHDVDKEEGSGIPCEEKVVLKARDLVPHYKLSDVKNFLNAFFRVDKNLSGYLDVEEWVEFFLAMNQLMSSQSARQLFSHIDSNRDGVLSLHELVPVIFAEASPNQVAIILKHIDDEVTRNMSSYNAHAVYKEDMAVLFETYDADNIGYIRVQLIRDKLMRFHLPVAAQLAFNEKLKGIEDDDMINLAEFIRLFITYLSLQKQED